MNQQMNATVKKDKLEIIDWLIEHFPSAFFKKGNQVKPLKIGIFDDIIDKLAYLMILSIFTSVWIAPRLVRNH